MQKRDSSYYLIYSVNFSVLHCCVVEVYACRGAQSWWGGSLACTAHSLIKHVISGTTRTNLLTPLFGAANTYQKPAFSSCPRQVTSRMSSVRIMAVCTRRAIRAVGSWRRWQSLALCICPRSGPKYLIRLLELEIMLKACHTACP
jgi:hypothetical protein